MLRLRHEQAGFAAHGMRELVLVGVGWAVVFGIFAFRLFQFWPFTVDDAYITMREARNFARGLGPVYNIGGPRVEAYTSFLHFLLQAAAIAAHCDVIVFVKVLGSLAGAVCLLAAGALAGLLIENSSGADGKLSRVIVLTGPAIIATSPMLPIGSIAGLETSVFAALVTCAAYLVQRLLAGNGGTGHAVIAGTVAGLTTWTRPEGILLTGVLLCAAGIAARKTRAHLTRVMAAAAVAVCMWLVLLGFRWVEFHKLQPNTYYAKMAGSAIDRVFHGLNYTRDWAVLNGGFVLLAIAIASVFLSPPSRRTLPLICVVLVFCQIGIVIYEGGDWMPHLRMLVPLLGVLAALVSAGCAALIRRLPSGPGYFASLLIPVVIGAAFTAGLRPEFRRAMNEVQTRLYGWNDAHRPLALWLANWEQERIGKGEAPLTAALMDIGMVGWESDVRIIDIIGLADPEWAAENYQSKGERRYPATRLLARDKPDVVVLVSHSPPWEHPQRWYPLADAEIANKSEFWHEYTEAGIYTHKQFGSDAYLLHVFVRNDLRTEAPQIIAPKARAVST